VKRSQSRGSFHDRTDLTCHVEHEMGFESSFEWQTGNISFSCLTTEVWLIKWRLLLSLVLSMSLSLLDRKSRRIYAGFDTGSRTPTGDMAFSREVLMDSDSRAWMWFRNKSGRWEGCSEGTWMTRAFLVILSFNLIINDRQLQVKNILDIFVCEMKDS